MKKKFSFRIVKASRIFWPFILNLRNEKETLSNMFSKRRFGTQEFFNEMKGRSRFYRVCLCDGRPVGYFKLIDFEISIAVVEDMRGCGVGSFMLDYALKNFSGELNARIRIDNVASLGLFRKFGFIPEYVNLVKVIK